MEDTMAVHVSADLTFEGRFRTVGDIRAYLAELDKYQVPDDTKVDEGSAWVYLRGAVQPADCGEHTYLEGRKIDALVNLHECRSWQAGD